MLSESHVWPTPGNVWLALVLGIAALVWWRLGPGLVHAAPASWRRSLLGLVALAARAVALAVRVPLFAGVGDRVDRPVDVADVDSKYTLGIGTSR